MLVVVLGPALLERNLGLARILALRISVVNFLLAALCLALWRAAMLLTRLPRGAQHHAVARWVLSVAMRVTLCTGVAALILWFRHPDRLAVPLIAAFWGVGFASLLLWRGTLIGYDLVTRLVGNRDRQVVLVGSGPRAQAIAQELQLHPRWHYHLLGFVDSRLMDGCDGLLGSLDELESLLMRHVVDEVIIALPMKSNYDGIQAAIAACERVGVQSVYSMDLFATEVAKRRSVDQTDASAVVLHMVHNDHRRIFKRAVDLAGAAAGIALLSPLLAVVALLVRVTSKGPVIFCQDRYGLNKRTFRMYKFRSMVADAEKQQARLEHLNETTGPVFKIREDPRITTVGRFIRKTSIDELPQLFNVLRGDMSLVGPRPLPMRDVSRFSEPWLMRRFSVRPGLTGLWQVSGRSNTGFAHWIKLDLEYIDRWSFLLDLKILARTVPAVLKKEGAA